MKKNMENKVAVVTGAGGLLCSKVSIMLAQNGAKVALLGRHLEKLAIVEKAIKEQGGQAQCYIVDVNDVSAMEEIAKRTLADLGPCDLLINGAGGNNKNAITSITEFDEKELDPQKSPDMMGFFNLDMASFQSVLDNNTMGTVIPTYIYARQMAGRGGAILNFASMNSYCPLTKVPAYAMAKAAITNWTKWIATYLAPAKIRVNAVAPGFFVNERSVKLLGTVENGLTERGKQVMDHTPQYRFGKAEDLLGCVAWLLDDEAASFVTGITVPVDGGFLAHSGV